MPNTFSNQIASAQANIANKLAPTMTNLSNEINNATAHTTSNLSALGFNQASQTSPQQTYTVQDGDTINNSRILNVDSAESFNDMGKSKKLLEMGIPLDKQKAYGLAAKGFITKWLKDNPNEKFEDYGADVYGRPLIHNNKFSNDALNSGLYVPTDRYDPKANALYHAAAEKRKLLFGGDAEKYFEIQRQYNIDPQKPGVSKTIKNTVRALGSATQQLVGGIGDAVLDAVTTKNMPAWTGNDGTGNNTLLDKFKSDESANANFHYNPEEVQFRQNEAVAQWHKGNYGKALQQGVVASPEMLAQSAPTIATMFVPGTAVTKPASWLLGTAKAAKAAETAAVASKGAEAIANTAGTSSFLKSTAQLANANAGFGAVVAQTTNDNIDEYTKNNNGVGPAPADIARMTATNVLQLGLDRYAFKEIMSSKGTANKFVDNMKMAVGLSAPEQVVKAAGVVIKTAAAMGEEGAQEYVQQWAQILNEKLGTTKYGSLENLIKNPEVLNEALGAGIMGAGMGASMSSAHQIKDIGSVTKSGLGVVYDATKAGVFKGLDKFAGEETKAKNTEISAAKQAAIESTPTVDVRAGLTDAINTFKQVKEDPSSNIDAIKATMNNLHILEAANDNPEYAKYISNIKQNMSDLLATKDITSTTKDVKFGSEAATSDFIETAYKSASKQTPTLISNLKTIAIKNGLDDAKFNSIIKNAAEVEYEASEGGRSYRSYGRTIRALQEAGADKNAYWINKYTKQMTDFKQATENSIDILKDKVSELEQDKKAGKLTSDGYTTLDKDTYASLGMKPFKIYHKDIMDGKGPIYDIIKAKERTLKGLDTEATSSGINLDTGKRVKIRDTKANGKDSGYAKSGFEQANKMISYDAKFKTIEGQDKKKFLGFRFAEDNKRITNTHSYSDTDTVAVIVPKSKTYMTDQHKKLMYKELDSAIAAKADLMIGNANSVGKYDHKSKEINLNYKQVRDYLTKNGYVADGYNTGKFISADKKVTKAVEVTKDKGIKEEITHREIMHNTESVTDAYNNNYTKGKEGIKLGEHPEQVIDVTKILSHNKEANKLVSEGVATVLEGKISKFVKDATTILSSALSKHSGDKSYSKSSLLEEDIKLKDSPFRSMLYNKDGVINENVATSIATAAEEYMAFNAKDFRQKTRKDIARMFNMDENEVTPEMFKAFRKGGISLKMVANSIGTSVLNNLGLRARKDGVDSAIYDKLVTDAGVMGIIYMKEKGYIKYDNTMTIKEYARLLDNTDFVPIDSDAKVLMLKAANQSKLHDISKGSQETFKSLAEYFNLDSTMERGPVAEQPVTKTVENTRARKNKITDIPQKDIDVLNTLTSHKYKTVDFGISWVIDPKNYDRVTELLGYKGADELAEMSKYSRESAEAKNRDIQDSIDVLKNLSESGMKEMYFDWFFTRNGRFMLDSNTINPQTDKQLHRWLVVPETNEVTIDPKNDKQMLPLYFALAQAVGYGTDKKSTTSVIAKGKQVIELGSKGLMKILEDADEQHKYEAEFEIEHLGHALQAVETLQAYEEAIKNNTSFKTNISGEFDAVTSGFGIRLMQMPLLNNITDWLQKVGVFTGEANKDRSMNDELSSGKFLDSYQTLAADIKKADMLGDVSEKMLPLWNILESKLPEVTTEVDPKDSNSLKAVVTKELRTLFKNPFMTFNYAAGMNSIKRSLAMNIIGKLVDELSASKSKGQLYDYISNLVQIEKGSNLRDLLREHDLSDIKLKQEITIGKTKIKTLDAYLVKLIEDTYGNAVEKSLTKNFGAFVAANNTINNAFRMMFAAFKVRYDEELSKIGKDEIVTAERKLEIIKSLRDEFPIIKGPDSTDVKNGVAIVSQKPTESSPKFGASQTHLSNTHIVKNGGFQKTLKAQAIVKEYEAAMSAGAVIPIHFIDGAIMANTIMENNPFLAIHDAIIPNLDSIQDTVSKYNENMYAVNKDYNLINQIADMLERIPAELQDKIPAQEMFLKAGEDSSIQESSQAYKVKFSDIQYLVNQLANRNNDARADLYKKDMQIVHMAAMPGSSFITKGTELPPSKKYKTDATKFKPEMIVKEDKVTKVDSTNVETKSSNDVIFRSSAADDTIAQKQAKAFKKLKDNPLASKESMVQLLDKMKELDGDSISPEHYSHLKNVINSLNPEFFPALNVYMNKATNNVMGAMNLTKKRIELTVSKRPQQDRNSITNSEMYVHELIHAYVEFARNGKYANTEARPLIRELEKLWIQAASHITWKDLLPTVSLDEVSEKEKAKQLYDYMFNNKQGQGMAEFIANAMTNEKVITKLKSIEINQEKSFWQRISDYCMKLLHAITSNNSLRYSENNVHTEVVNLVADLAQFNNTALKIAEEAESTSTKIYNLLEKGNKAIIKAKDFLSDKAIEGVITDRLPPNATKWQTAKFLASNLIKLTSKPEYRSSLEALLTSLGAKPEGFIQSLVRDFKEPENIERTLEKHIADATMIDQMRDSITTSSRESLVKAFNEPLNKSQKTALTLVALDTDMSSLTKRFTVKELGEVVNDDTKLQEHIDKVKTEIARIDRENLNWYSTQAYGLGYYMATHKAGIAQNFNAHNIATFTLTEHQTKTPNKKIVRLVDELASLYALKYTPLQSRNVFKDILTKNEAGVSNFLESHNGFKKESQDKLFNSPAQMIKGYTKELFDNDISLIIKPVSAYRELENKGYKLVSIMGKAEHDTSAVPMALYRADTFATQRYNRSATNLTNMVKRGTSLTDVRYEGNEILAKEQAKRDINAMNQKRAEIVKEMFTNPEFNVHAKQDLNIAPLVDEKGNVVDYRYMMSKRDKRELLNQDLDGFSVLSKMYSSNFDKLETAMHDKNVLDTIFADMKDNYIKGEKFGNNNRPYVKITENSPDANIREIYRILPDKMKAEIKKSKLGYIAVRQDLLLHYFGFRNMSILDTWVGKLTPKELHMTIRMTEKIWMELVKITKADILIRTPIVLWNNIVSNFAFSVFSGNSPIKVFRRTMENVRNVNDYMETHRQILTIEFEIKSGNYKNRSKLNSLNEKLEKNPLKPIMDFGMYQSIIEDPNFANADGNSSNKVSKFIEDKTENMPEILKVAGNWLFLSEKTSVFKLLTKATQYSDLVARATEYQNLLDKGVDKEEAKLRVLDAFINYNIPSTKYEQWANDMGFVMFTKSFKRLQRVINKDIANYPLYFIIEQLLQHTVHDFESIDNQSIFAKNYTGMVHTPVDVMQHVLTPSAIEWANWVNKKL